MSKIFYSFLVVSVVCGCGSASNLADFSQGVLTGLSDPNSQSVCTVTNKNQVDIDSIAEQAQVTVHEFLRVIDFHFAFLPKLKQDLKTLLFMIEPQIENCNFEGFANEIYGRLSIEGVREMAENLLSYKETVLEDVRNIEKCQFNYPTCGQSVGEIIRLLTGASL